MNLTCKSLLFLFLLASLVACAGSSPSSPETQELSQRLPFSSQVADPCKIRNPDHLLSPEIERVFPKDDTQLEAFQGEYETSPETALKRWLITTTTFESAKTIDDLELKKLAHTGTTHEGIYEARLVQDPTREYILKVSIYEQEPDQIWKLQNSVIGHPECFLKADSGFSRMATREEVAHFPKLSRALEAANFPILPSRAARRYWKQSRTHSFPILFEKAPGQPLASLIDTPEMAHAYRSAGKSLGYLHSLLAQNPSEPFKKWITVTHGDLHGNNVFFDKATNQVTFIDFESMKQNTNLEYDFHQLAYKTLDSSINTGNSKLAPYAEDLLYAEAKKRGMTVAHLFDWSYPAPAGKLHPQDALLGALEDPAVILEIPNSKAFKEVATRYRKFQAVVQGYLEAFPESKRPDVREYFGDLCRDTAEQFMRNYSRNPKGSIEPRLNTAIRHLFPDDFIVCIDENRFE